MRWFLPVLVVGIGCVQVQSSSAAPPTPVADSVGTLAGQEEAAEVLHQVASLPVEKRAEATASLAVLAVSCPYTRSALQVPLALQAAVMKLDAADFSADARADLLALQQGLAQHVAVLDLLGVDLAVPAGEDALAHGRTFAFVSREELLASSDPLALTATLVRDTNLLALGLSDAQLAAIEEHSRRVEQATGIPRPCPRDVWAVQPGHPWTLGSLLGDWTELLGRLEPAATSEGARQQVQQMRLLLEAQAAVNQEVRAG